MNKLLWSPIAAKTQGVLPPGARRAVEHASAPSGPRTLRLYYSGSLLRKLLSNSQPRYASS